MRPSELFNQPPDVKKMGLDTTETQPEFQFNIDQEITPADWSRLTEQLHYLRQNEHVQYTELVLLLKNLDPTSIQYEPPNVNYLEDARQRALGADTIDSIAQYVHITRLLRELDTGHNKLGEIPNLVWDEISYNRDALNRKGFRWIVINMTRNIKSIDEQHVQPIPDADWDIYLEKFGNGVAPERAELLLAMHDLAPQRPLPIDTSLWDALQEQLRSFRQEGKTYEFFRLADMMRRLAAVSSEKMRHEDNREPTSLPEVTTF